MSESTHAILFGSTIAIGFTLFGFQRRLLKVEQLARISFMQQELGRRAFTPLPTPVDAQARLASRDLRMAQKRLLHEQDYDPAPVEQIEALEASYQHCIQSAKRE